MSDEESSPAVCNKCFKAYLENITNCDCIDNSEIFKGLEEWMKKNINKETK